MVASKIKDKSKILRKKIVAIIVAKVVPIVVGYVIVFVVNKLTSEKKDKIKQ